MIGEFLKESYLNLTSTYMFPSGSLVNPSTLRTPVPRCMSLPGRLACASVTVPQIEYILFPPQAAYPGSLTYKSFPPSPLT